MSETREVKHTPTPWHVTVNRAQDLVCAGDEVVADCASGDLPDITKANAEFIVRAVNCHDELVSACTFAYRRALQTQDQDSELINKLFSALAKAEGRE